jgi:hypothetical protein
MLFPFYIVTVSVFHGAIITDSHFFFKPGGSKTIGLAVDLKEDGYLILNHCLFPAGYFSPVWDNYIEI